MRTRLMNQPADARLYSGAIDCFVKLIKKDGVKGLYAGTYSVVLCDAVMYCTALCYAVLYYTVLYCTVLYCTTPFVRNVILSLNMTAHVSQLRCTCIGTLYTLLPLTSYVSWQIDIFITVQGHLRLEISVPLLSTLCFFLPDSSSSFFFIFFF